MSPRVEPGVLAAMAAHARDESPREAVGAVLGRGDDAVDYVRLANVSDAPCTSFALDGVDLARVEGEARDRGLCLLGLFHSHPGGTPRPSETDRRAAWPGRFCWIGAPRGDGTLDLGTSTLDGCRLTAVRRSDQKRIV